jgi:signal transduction histidine kinase/ActR/RegA family two-component response regulator
MKPKKKRRRYIFDIPVVIGAVLVMLVITTVYAAQLNRTVTSNINGTISELADHDLRSMQAHIEEMWENLTNLEDRFVDADCQNVEEVESLMNVESSYSNFSHLYLVAQDGMVYTDKLLSYDPNKSGENGRINLLPYFTGAQDRVVARFNDVVTSVGITKECILYGIALKDVTIAGIPMAGLVGICDIRTMQDKMIIESFSNGETFRGYSAVIDSNGDYIVSEEETVSLGQISNFYDRLERAQKAELTEAEIRQKMDARETFRFSMTTENGVEKLVYCTPFTESDITWYFMLSVEESVFSQQNHTFLAMSMVLLVSILVVLFILLLYVILSQKKVMAANAEAKAKSQFLANMSHEIRTPLNGIIGLTYLMEKDVNQPERQEILRSRLQKMESTAEYLLSLINNILDISKLQSGKVELNPASISPELIVDAIWSMQKSNTEHRGIALVLEKDISVPWILGDDVLIKRVLMNIVGNAAKFTPEGGQITLSVSQTLADEGNVTTCFVCKDTGCGMSEAFLGHIWDVFSQEQNSASAAGTGLGMPISKMLVEAMGGIITVESKLGQGSTFTVSLCTPIAQPPMLLQNPPQSSEKSMNALHILVAEDNALNAEILMDILETEGMTAVCAENGQVAVETFRQSPEGAFDVILMDMQMPVMDGCTAAAAIRHMPRRDAKTIPIFACTANSFKEDRNRALESGMNDFLSKPIDVKELLRKIGREKR